MLIIDKEKFEIQFSDMEIKQRLYNEESIISIQVHTNFYPKMLDKKIISGSIDLTIDVTSLKNIKDIEGKNYSGDNVKLLTSISRNGKWETNTYYDVVVSIKEKNDNKFKIEIQSNEANIKMDGKTRLTSLYTTSMTEESVKDNFELEDFYPNPVIKEINGRAILKFIAKSF